ncbi:MAG TPA: 23S rRNA (pseudouridine(1915)-N(3))-methyltransferase RlmH [Longimicrobiales bacterium]|nr:23S rRNA (pseudouridine(1915)-N(3))-methyltransferase RlmH [Longimicrobiales bacterium]
MKVVVVAVGRVKGALEGAVADYEARAARYWKLEVVEVPAGVKGSRGAPAERVLKAEAERILARLPPGLDVVALTREGRGTSSRELAAYLQELGTRSAPGVAFVIGGAFGLGEAVLGRAARKLSLSALTLPHEMARLVLAEQLYRAGTIVRGEPYHKA